MHVLKWFIILETTGILIIFPLQTDRYNFYGDQMRRIDKAADVAEERLTFYQKLSNSESPQMVSTPFEMFISTCSSPGYAKWAPRLVTSLLEDPVVKELRRASQSNTYEVHFRFTELFPFFSIGTERLSPRNPRKRT